MTIYWNKLKNGKHQWQDRDGKPVDPPTPPLEIKGRGSGKPKGWPMECEASGVHYTQKAEAEKFMRDNGCPTEFTPDGNAIYTSRAHRKQAFKIRGIFDKNAGYGDRSPD